MQSSIGHIDSNTLENEGKNQLWNRVVLIQKEEVLENYNKYEGGFANEVS